MELHQCWIIFIIDPNKPNNSGTGYFKPSKSYHKIFNPNKVTYRKPQTKKGFCTRVTIIHECSPPYGLTSLVTVRLVLLDQSLR